MKRSKKIWIIVALSLVVAGAAVAFATVAANGFRFEALSNVLPYEEKHFSQKVEALSGITIEDVDANVMLTGTDKKEVEITYYENEKQKYDIQISDDGRLHIAYRENRNWTEFLFNMNFSMQPKVLQVSVPSSVLDSMDISTVSGTVDLANLQVQGSINVHSASGEIRIQSSAATGPLSVQNVSGGVLLSEVQAQDKIEISSTSGNLDFQTVQAQGNVSANTISGEINLYQPVFSGDISLESTSGELRFEELSGQNLFLKTTSGEIWGSLVGTESDYAIQTDSISGDMNLPNGTHGSKQLKISTISGDARIRFIS